jgi:two-component system LytT family sensor kinase
VGLTDAMQQPPTPSARILPGSNVRNGIGLPNLRARLEALYAGRYRFDISSPTTGGVSVRIEIPFRREVPSEQAEAVETR